MYHIVRQSIYQSTFFKGISIKTKWDYFLRTMKIFSHLRFFWSPLHFERWFIFICVVSCTWIPTFIFADQILRVDPLGKYIHKIVF